jgi:hypothetical protein
MKQILPFRLAITTLAVAGPLTAAPTSFNVRDYPEPGIIGTLPAYGIFARHVRNLELANIRLNLQTTDLRPAAAFVEVDGLEIDNLKPQVADGVRAAVFSSDVRGITIRNSSALEALK